MADIQTYLKKILSAVYGKDVRQSIHDAIKQCYYDGKIGAVDLTERERAAKAEAALGARINNLSNFKSNDAEIADVRVDFKGDKYDSAGDAVRAQAKSVHDHLSGVMQKDGSPNPLQPLMFDQYAYYHGSTQATSIEPMESPRFTVGDFEEYKNTKEEVEGTTHCMVARLVNPISKFSDFNGEYTAVIKSGNTITHDVQIIFSGSHTWNESIDTFCRANVRVAKGYNLVKLTTARHFNNGDDKYTHVCVHFGSTLITDTKELEIYIVKSDAVLEWINERSQANSKYIAPNANDFMWYYNNLNPTFTVNGSKIIFSVPDDTFDTSVWRYAVFGCKLGKDIKGKKILVRSNTLHLSNRFGIGTTYTQWYKKKIDIKSGSYAIIDLESFIADNNDLTNHTGDYYITYGMDFGTVDHVNALNLEFEIMFTNDKDVIDPYEAFLGYTPADFAPAVTSDYITCWGDSLTAQGGWTDTLSRLSGRTVYNGGTGGENVKVIAARQGADAMVVNNITIPAGTTPVTIANRATDGGINTVFGHKAMPLLQGGAHVNPVVIGDVEGTLKWTGANYADETGSWTFTRSKAGTAVKIDRETVIRTAFDRERNTPHLMVIFIGQNGGYASIEDLINTHKLMINHAKAKHVIVLGLSSGTEASRKEYETAMRYEFGRYFISLREYLSKYGLADAGLTPTAEDTAAMAKGQVPPQLLLDSVHFTPTTRTVIGNMLYKKCVELNIF